MGIIKQGILGGFKNKVGSVVGTSWKGIAVMKSLPLSVANPRTASQVSNRNRFKACSEFASQILSPIIKPLMDRFAGQMSGYNMFCKLNKDCFENPSAITWENLVISKGRILSPVSYTVSSAGGNSTITVTNPASDRYGMPTDKLYVLATGNSGNHVVWQGETSATRGNSTTTSITLTGVDLQANSIAVYVAYLRADGSEVSDSLYKYMG